MSVQLAPMPTGGAPLRFRVFHRHFDAGRVYALVAISDYAETAPARLWFVNERGWLWAVDQRRCLCVDRKRGASPRL